MATVATASALPTSFSGAPSTPSTAMDALFSGQPAGEGAAAIQETPQPTHELGDLGKLGEAPPDGTQPTESGDPASSAPGSTPEANWLEFSVTDDQGRRKMKVDLNNKEQMARLLPQAAGFRKMQADRDRVTAELTPLKARAAELEGNWATLEAAYSDGGIEGLVDLLGGKKGHFAEWKRGEFEKDTRFAAASDTEKRAMKAEQELEARDRREAARDKESQRVATQAAADKEAAQYASVEAQLTPVFNKYRFAGTLGNEATEAFFDKAIWDQTLAVLEELPETTPLTNAMVEKEFKSRYLIAKATIGKMGAAKAKTIIDSKKATAGANAAAAATRGMGGAAAAPNDMAAHIRRGGVAGLTDGLMSILNGRK